MSFRSRVLALAFALSVAGCDDGPPAAVAHGDAGSRGDVAPNGDLAPSDDAVFRGSAPSGATRYRLRVENLAGATLPTALSPGVWTAHRAADPLFTEGAPDRGEGLEALAEDGDPSALAAARDPARSGILGGPLGPGEVAETEVWRTEDATHLSFAMMILESNDVFLAPSGAGIDLGAITAETDVTDQLLLWNAGTEDDEAPGLGPHQPPRQSAPNTGSAEGVLRRWESGTRTLPLAIDLVEVGVTERAGTYTLTFRNVSRERGVFVTSISPLFWVVHSDEYGLYAEGAPQRGNGLAQLAEIADARTLATTTPGEPGVLSSAPTSALVGTGSAGLAHPGDAFAIEVTPDAEHPFVSVAAMVVGTNDAFLAFDDGGLRLIDEDGALRSAEAVERAARRWLAIWDAGTEINEVPGAGWHQGPAGGLDDAPADPDPRVRRYDDVTNDLAGPGAGGLVEVTIRRRRGRTFEVRVVNRSRRLPFQALLTPFVWAVHDARPALLELGTPRSPGLIELGEDCKTNLLYTETVTRAGVATSGVNGTTVAPSFPGEVFSFEITADPAHRYFNMISMPYPSNDMLVAFEPPGVPVLDARGAPRSDEAIAADVGRLLYVWDTGTEANEGGGGGYHAVPSQNDVGMQDWGPSEGDGTVRAEPDPAFSYPAVDDLVRVTITPVRE